MKQAVFKLLLIILVGLLEGCGSEQKLSFTPVAKLNREKYTHEKKFYRSGVLEKLSEPTGYFWSLKTKI